VSLIPAKQMFEYFFKTGHNTSTYFLIHNSHSRPIIQCYITYSVDNALINYDTISVTSIRKVYMITMLEPTEAQSIKLREWIHAYWHALPPEFNPLKTEFLPNI
jgi:hypothetical protein